MYLSVVSIEVDMQSMTPDQCCDVSGVQQK